MSPNQASQAAYLNSEDESHRVLYQLQTDNWNGLTAGPHCSFTDSGCLGFCPGKSSVSDWMHGFVGEAVNLFLQAISSDLFNRNYFTRDHFLSANVGSHDVELFVNKETP